MVTWSDIRARDVLFEDAAALVLNKPAGVAVMGERVGTDLVRMAAEDGEQLFPAHRIDKVTSGAVLFAKQLGFHGPLTRQFSKRSVEKAYLAVTRSVGLPEHGVIDLPLSVGRKNRVRVAGNRADITYDEQRQRWSLPPAATTTTTRTYPSTTSFLRIQEHTGRTLLVVHPQTGRRHQIRVHLAWIGHPILGESLFGDPDRNQVSRTFLHSWRLSFTSPATGGVVAVTAPPGDDFWAALPDAQAAGRDARLRAAAADAGHQMTDQ